MGARGNLWIAELYIKRVATRFELAADRKWLRMEPFSFLASLCPSAPILTEAFKITGSRPNHVFFTIVTHSRASLRLITFLKE